MACAVVTACRRTTRVKSMAIGREKRIQRESHRCTPSHSSLVTVCGRALWFNSGFCYLSLWRMGLQAQWLFAVFPWTGHLSHLDLFSCPFVLCLRRPTPSDRDRTILSLLVWLIHPTLIQYISQNPLSSHPTCLQLLAPLTAVTAVQMWCI